MRRDPERTKLWCALVDGSRHQLRDLRQVQRDRGVPRTIVPDFIHVCEYLWGAAWAFYREGERGRLRVGQEAAAGDSPRTQRLGGWGLAS